MALRGRREATRIEQVLLPHLDAAYNLARWLLRDAAEAEDVVQNAMLRAIDYFASFRGGDGRAWLLKIVRRVAYDTLARRQQAPEVAFEDDEGTELRDSADDPETELQHRERQLLLDDAIAALPPLLRECLVLHELEELSYKEIAHITGIPIGTVMSRLWRARQSLLRLLPPAEELRR